MPHNKLPSHPSKLWNTHQWAPVSVHVTVALKLFLASSFVFPHFFFSICCPSNPACLTIKSAKSFSFSASLRFTLRTGYYGLSFNTSQLHADPYISCFMSAAVEIPANILMWLTLRYLPRRLSVICILVLAAASLFFIQLVPQG